MMANEPNKHYSSICPRCENTPNTTDGIKIARDRLEKKLVIACVGCSVQCKACNTRVISEQVQTASGFIFICDRCLRDGLQPATTKMRKKK